jgi:hypothetical protein
MTKGSSSSSSGAGSGSSTGAGSSSGGGGYTTTSSGTNDQVRQSTSRIASSINAYQGNHYCSRDYGSGASNSNSYHYSNTNGSYYYSNPNVSRRYSYFWNTKITCFGRARPITTTAMEALSTTLESRGWLMRCRLGDEDGWSRL